MYEVKIFDRDSSQVEEFKAFASRLYTNDPFRMNQSEIFPHNLETAFFLGYKNNESIGRACGIVNPEIVYDRKKTGLIGFYECEDDITASRHLINSISEYFSEKNYNYLIGPLNGSTWHQYRVTEPDDEKPFFLDNYHKDWYAKQFLENKFSVIAKYYSTKIENLNTSYERVEKFEKRFVEHGVTIREIDLQNFEEDMRKIHSICIESFKNNFLYTPIQFEVFLETYRKIQNIIDPKFVLIAENSEGQPLGFIFAINNLFEKNKKSIIIKSVAISPRKRSKGLGTLLVEKIHETAYKNNYDEVIHALMHEHNRSMNISRGHVLPYRTYLLFGKDL